MGSVVCVWVGSVMCVGEKGEDGKGCMWVVRMERGSLVPSPPPQLSSLAVRITRRRPGRNYHVMYATDVIT